MPADAAPVLLAACALLLPALLAWAHWRKGRERRGKQLPWETVARLGRR